MEVKDYESPALKKKEEGSNSGGTTNNMTAMIMAKRNQMKKGESITTSKKEIKEKPNNLKPKSEINKISFQQKHFTMSSSNKTEQPKNEINKKFPVEIKKEISKPQINKIEQPKKTTYQKIIPENKKTNNTYHIHNTISNPKGPSTTGGPKPPISTGKSFAERMAAIQAIIGGKSGNQNA